VRTLKEMIVNNQKVTFSFYRDGQLWYETECGFRFPVPVAEAGTATDVSRIAAVVKSLFIMSPGYFDVITKCARRFFDHAVSVWPASKGNSLP